LAVTSKQRIRIETGHTKFDRVNAHQLSLLKRHGQHIIVSVTLPAAKLSSLSLSFEGGSVCSQQHFFQYH
jgi:hypothetical protein